MPLESLKSLPLLFCAVLLFFLLTYLNFTKPIVLLFTLAPATQQQSRFSCCSCSNLCFCHSLCARHFTPMLQTQGSSVSHTHKTNKKNHTNASSYLKSGM